MGFARTLRTVAKSPLLTLTKLDFLRRRIIFELKQHYFDELEIAVPLAPELLCPISSGELWASFTEIFVSQEYLPVFDHMTLPDRWLDLGCHAGYFSLYIAWLRARKGMSPQFKALLVDGDSRMRKAVDNLVSINDMAGRISFHHGVIAGQTGLRQFAERSHMASSLAHISPSGQAPGRELPVESVSASQLLTLMAPPYDLIKVDIEGAEYDFLTAYKPVLDVCKFLLIEWHSWHPGGGGAAQISDLARASGFDLLSDVVPAHKVPVAENEHQCGVFLFGKK